MLVSKHTNGGHVDARQSAHLQQTITDLQERWGSQAVAACRNGQRTWAAGLLVVHQAPPTAKGMHFLTLEDEYGFINVVVRPHVYERHRRVIRGAVFLLVQGVVERKEGVSNLVAARFAVLK